MEEGLKAEKKALDQHRPGNAQPKNKPLINLLEFVLSKNNFDFDLEHYLQIWGCPMGTKLTPSYADLYISWFENQFIYTVIPFNLSCGKGFWMTVS